MSFDIRTLSRPLSRRAVLLVLLAGRRLMLGFGAYTWAALGAHVLYTLAVALSYEALARRPMLTPRRGTP